MFVIREAQFEALAAARREDFVREMMDHLRASYDAAFEMSAGDLRALVIEGTAAAEGYSLFADADIRPFLECRVVYGPMFPAGDDDDWAREILDDPALDADDKALRLEAQLELLLSAAEEAEAAS
ncbi:MAG: hypothetical protein U0326_20565 [Polyangiales bacterium]